MKSKRNIDNKKRKLPKEAFAYNNFKSRDHRQLKRLEMTK
jgi:hypothetical protein